MLHRNGSIECVHVCVCVFWQYETMSMTTTTAYEDPSEHLSNAVL